MEIRILETAKEDLREGWKFYERSLAGLGDYFLDCVQADVRSLQIYAGVHEKAEGFHRMLVKRVSFRRLVFDRGRARRDLEPGCPRFSPQR